MSSIIADLLCGPATGRHGKSWQIKQIKTINHGPATTNGHAAHYPRKERWRGEREREAKETFTASLGVLALVVLRWPMTTGSLQ